VRLSLEEKRRIRSSREVLPPQEMGVGVEDRRLVSRSPGISVQTGGKGGGDLHAGGTGKRGEKKKGFLELFRGVRIGGLITKKITKSLKKAGGRSHSLESPGKKSRGKQQNWGEKEGEVRCKVSKGGKGNKGV